jgi:hypothetical protein
MIRRKDVMAGARGFTVLVATDGSDHARAAITTARNFPWPDDTRVRVVAARTTGLEHRRSILLAALDQNADAAAESARRTLAGRSNESQSAVASPLSPHRPSTVNKGTR